MRITRNLEFQTGSKEEKLPYETTDFPYVACGDCIFSEKCVKEGV